MRPLQISLLDSERASAAHRVTVDASALVRMLTDYQPRASKSGPAWSPIVWADDARKAAGAERVCALVYDLDDPTDAELAGVGEVLAREDWLYALHETYTAGRWRLCLPLAADLSPRDYPDAWARVASVLGIRPDPTGRDLARLFYLPSHPEGQRRDAGCGGSTLLTPDSVGSSLRGVDPSVGSSLRGVDPSVGSALRGLDPSVGSSLRGVLPTLNGGSGTPDFDETKIDPRGEIPKIFGSETDFQKANPKIFDFDAIRACVSRLPNPTRRSLLDALSFKLKLRKGERENQLHQLVSALVTVLPSEMGWVEVEAIFNPVVEQMEEVNDQGVDYYMARVRSSFDRGDERRKSLNEQREAAREFFQVKPGDPEEWRGQLIQVQTKEGPAVRACSANVDLILENDPRFAGHIRFNGLARRLEVTGGELAQHARETLDSNLAIWLQRSEYELHIAKQEAGSSLLTVAKRHEYNPVSTYLDGLVWDGIPRIENALHEICAAIGNDRHIRNISRKFFISAAARALQPGCKVDTVLVLQGRQGTGKTSFVEELANGWYTTVHARIDDKDTRMQATGSWLVELSELASAAKSTIESLRGFLTQRSDDIRIPYATNIENYPRRCVFVGTTNSDAPLIDHDGNRRYWVVATEKFDMQRLRRTRDQLWAEAVYCFREWQKEDAAGVPDAEQQYRWWLVGEEHEISEEENGVFMVENPMHWDIEQWAMKLEKPKYGEEKLFTSTEIAKKALHFTSERLAQDHQITVRLGKALKDLGWERVRRGTADQRHWAWKVPEKYSLTPDGNTDT